MRGTDLSAGLFVALVTLTVLFQLGLALGAPWGHLAMGGKFPGRFPPRMRVAALVQAALLVGFGLVVLSRAGPALPQGRGAAGWAIWGVVGFSALSLALNLATPSRAERRLWAPVAAALTATSLQVALS